MRIKRYIKSKDIDKEFLRELGQTLNQTLKQINFFCRSKKKSWKLNRILERVDREFHSKIIDGEDIKTTGAEYLKSLKNFFTIYDFCLMETCGELIFYELEFISDLLKKIFYSFKIQLAFMLRFTVKNISERDDLLQSATDIAGGSSKRTVIFNVI